MARFLNAINFTFCRNYRFHHHPLYSYTQSVLSVFVAQGRRVQDRCKTFTLGYCMGHNEGSNFFFSFFWASPCSLWLLGWLTSVLFLFWVTQLQAVEKGWGRRRWLLNTPDPAEKKTILVNRLLRGKAIAGPSLCEWHLQSGHSCDSLAEKKL